MSPVGTHFITRICGLVVAYTAIREYSHQKCFLRMFQKVGDLSLSIKLGDMANMWQNIPPLAQKSMLKN